MNFILLTSHSDDVAIIECLHYGVFYSMNAMELIFSVVGEKNI